ncbi:tRNA (cytosine(38)-C(5))-methyltransferase [Chironomus tepperi]|uniref:tRNA (cytosine(38)-C(5))-methyltransferase n=1 Tax=Chironomus tepperi TaxID=113505 RepID=UPI00391F184C
MDELSILELFSGIGGMHYALKESQVPGQVLAAIDINTNANEVYRHNFKDSKCINGNIVGLDSSPYQKVNTILCSPSCQPFTRNGKQKDVEDKRNDAFMSLCTLIKSGSFKNLKYLLMENVVGFETSQMHDIFIDALKSSGFYHREFIISPHQLDIPNTRHRYYCVARKEHDFSFDSGCIHKTIPNYDHLLQKPQLLLDYVNSDDSEDLTPYFLSKELLEKRFNILDIQTNDSRNTMCFTKSYSNYIEGTGSVYCNMTRQELDDKIAEIERNDMNLEMKEKLKLRFFTPMEVARLMRFPKDFTFPATISRKSQYKLLGNSINVTVVSELIKVLHRR